MNLPRPNVAGRRRAAACLLAAATAACSILDPRPDPSRFFLLATLAKVETAAPAPGSAHESVGVGPVSLPEYLERPELVRRSASHEVVPSAFERWAEPLGSQTARVLGEDVALLTGAAVTLYPWLSPAPQRQVVVHIHRFEPVEDARIELVARVRVVRFDAGESSDQRHEISVPLAARDGSAVAAAMSEALLELARRVAGSGTKAVHQEGGRD